MPREFLRSRRIEEAIQRTLSAALSGKIRDPRLVGVTITDVRVSRDLSVARVFFAALTDGTDLTEVGEAFANAAGFFRSALARELRVRRVPELRFQPDVSLARARHLESLIGRATAQGAADEPAGDSVERGPGKGSC